MRQKMWLAALLLSLVIAIPSAAATTAPKATANNEGLFVSPVREYLNAEPQKASDHTITVANHSTKPMVITLSVLEFTVTDFSYNYEFKESPNPWVHFAQNNVSLEPGKSQTVTYTLLPPAAAEPGGHYFSILVTAALGGTTQTRLQAAVMLYITLSGNLRQSTEMKATQISHVVFGDIPFSITAENTGNTHVFAYLYGQLEGLSARPKTNEVAHLLMPGTKRSFSGTIVAPLLPGLYKASFGYTTDAGQRQEYSTWVVYIPAWAIAAMIGVVVLAIVLTRIWLHRKG